jgi:hypothetical protein
MVVDSYYLHHSGTSTNLNTVFASVTFDTNIVGIVCISSNLALSHGQLGAPGTVYQLTPGTQGYEFGPAAPLDSVTVSFDLRTVTVRTTASSIAPDDIRILTAARQIFPPVVFGGDTNLWVPPGLEVPLAATAFDPNNPPLPLTYSWTQLSGIPVTLSDANTSFATFTAPDVPDSGAVLVFQSVVSNGYQSITNLAIINVFGQNFPPAAQAEFNEIVSQGTLVTLDGSSSFDPDGDSLTFQWSQISGPTVTLANADTVNPSFIAPNVTAVQGSVPLVFQLIVNDGQVNSGPSMVTIIDTNVYEAPIANAGTNQTVNELARVGLDGTGSSSPGGLPLTFSWTQILGTHVTLAGANTATASFTAPQLNVGGSNTSITLTFQLTVSDGITNSSSTVDVRVNNVNHAPIADAGPNLTVPSGVTVTLEGTNSVDIDRDPLSFAWVQTAGPSVELSGANTASPTYVAPVVGPSGAVLTFQLTVSDGFGGTSSDSVTNNVTYVNHPPVADAGTNQTDNEGDLATLSGTASDPDNNPLTIQWTEISGPAITLLGDTTLSPSFIAPQVTRFETNVVLELAVDDGFGGSATSDVSIHIANINHPPVAQAPGNMTVPEGTTVALIGQGTDPDTEEQSLLVYNWVQTAGPSVSLTDDGANASFTAPFLNDGGDTNASVTLTFALTVTDPNGASGTSSVNVVVANVDHAPTAVAGPNQAVNEASLVTLNGSASSDPDGDSLTYSWVQLSGPAVTLAGADTALPEFTAPFVNAAGATLVFQLMVNDGFGGTSSATTTVTVNNINDPPNADHAQPSISTLWPPDHSMVKVAIVGVVDPNNNDTITITSVTQDEPTDGTGDGDTPVDAIINSDGTLLLRAERAASGDGRVYHIHFTASDFEGSASGVVEVAVPLNKKGNPAIDGGELYDSTQ